MLPQLSFLAAALAFPLIAVALPAGDAKILPAHLRGKRSLIDDYGVEKTVFEHEATGATLTFVTNSGICETTAGVNQYSGYVTTGTGQNMWFWFFEARTNPTTAPLATWFNGGPGCSSMIGLFQENGPCQFYNGDTKPSLNPHSWNTFANMLYVDQPIGTGFSYGTDPVTSTVTAAPYVWTLLQAFFASFPQYENRDFGIFTESYGGHYGPEFASYFQAQNKAIASGTVSGENINLVALGINNGWIDPIINYKSFIDYSYNNTYKPLISASQHTSFTNTFNTRCLPLLQKCTAITGTNSACVSAENTCASVIESAIINLANFDVYDIRQPSNDAFPPETYVTYLQNAAVVKAIGAKSTYTECSNPAGSKFDGTGDDSRSFLSTLSSVVQSGITVLIWAGDADWICNWFSGINHANGIAYASTAAFNAKSVASYTVNGKAAGEFKAVGNLSWLRVFGAGHEVPYYQPAVSLQAFMQTMKKGAIFST